MEGANHTLFLKAEDTQRFIIFSHAIMISAETHAIGTMPGLVNFWLCLLYWYQFYRRRDIAVEHALLVCDDDNDPRSSLTFAFGLREQLLVPSVLFWVKRIP